MSLPNRYVMMLTGLGFSFWQRDRSRRSKFDREAIFTEWWEGKDQMWSREKWYLYATRGPGERKV